MGNKKRRSQLTERWNQNSKLVIFFPKVQILNPLHRSSISSICVILFFRPISAAVRYNFGLRYLFSIFWKFTKNWSIFWSNGQGGIKDERTPFVFGHLQVKFWFSIFFRWFFLFLPLHGSHDSHLHGFFNDDNLDAFKISNSSALPQSVPNIFSYMWQ